MHIPNRIHSAAALIAASLFSFIPSSAGQLLSGHVPAAVASSRALGPVEQSRQLELSIGLPLRNQPELAALVEQIADPASPNYRHYLTAAQFTERFGPAAADYERLAAFFVARGFEITSTHTNRMILDVRGPAAAVERTFHVNMVRWSHPSRGEFFSPDREPSLDADVEVLDISGLDNFSVPRPMDLRTQPLRTASPLTTGSGPGGLFIGGDYREAYAPGVTLNGAGQSVGLLEFDGFYASDVTANFKQAGLSPVPVRTVLLDGFSGNPGSANDEVTLDIMMAAYMAPGASIIVYEGNSPNDVLNRMATDNLAHQLSSSWTFSPTNATTEQIFSEMIIQGQSLYQASGDSGAYHGTIMPPADDPNVTVVGGTSLTTSGPGGPWQSETTWSDGGGGVSTVWPIPSYQKNVNLAASGGSATMRNIPDVALLADIQSFLIADNGQEYAIGGTSAAAPLWAGFTALANQQAGAGGKASVGFLNPTIYSLGLGSHYASDLHDITTGSNGYAAVTGFDLATGWGTPKGQSLINDLTGAASVPAFSLSSSASTISFTPGGSGTSTINVNPQNGFTGSVSLSASGLPSGVTASFSPASAVTSSLLTLSSSASAAPGIYTVTINGTSGSLHASTTISLTVGSVAGFSLTASPSALSIAQGGNGSSTITLVPQTGFSGSVSVSVSSVPSGVTATWGTASSRSIQLNFGVSTTATPGTYSVTVTGTSGSLTSKVTISLTIAASTPPGFTLSASPSSLTIARGSKGSSTITLTEHNGFNKTVNVSLSGFPVGTGYTWSAGPAPYSLILTISPSRSAPVGHSTITVTGTSGSLTATTTISLTVQ